MPGLELHCPKCGAVAGEGAESCGVCGQPIADSGARESRPVAARVVYAGFWLRAVAYVIDSLLLGFAVGIVILMPLMRRGVIPADDPWALFTGVSRQIIALQLLVTTATWLYYASFESSTWQATPGKRVLGLYATDLQGKRLSFARASGRYFGKILSGTIFLVGFAMAGFTEKKQALHDIIAGCVVIRKAQ